MNDLFENHFIPQARQNLVDLPDDAKINLIVDSCHTTLKALVKDNVFVLVFLPNCTSITQPINIRILC
ncbi:hypothetical protein X975_05209, partial [Stegodyphus mimosarum]